MPRAAGLIFSIEWMLFSTPGLIRCRVLHGWLSAMNGYCFQHQVYFDAACCWAAYQHLLDIVFNTRSYSMPRAAWLVISIDWILFSTPGLIRCRVLHGLLSALTGFCFQHQV